MSICKYAISPCKEIVKKPIIWIKREGYLQSKSPMWTAEPWQCSKQVLRWPPRIATCPYSFSCLAHSPWIWTGLIDSLLTNRLWQKWCDVTFEIRYKKPETSRLEVLSRPLRSLALVKVSCHDVSEVCGEDHTAREGGLPTICEWAWKQISPQSSFHMRPQLWSTNWLQLDLDWARGAPANHIQICDPQNCERISVCCLKPLCIGVICYGAVDNLYSR